MTLRVSRSLLEAALLNMMNEVGEPEPPATDAPVNTPPPEQQPAAAPPPEDKTGRAAFNEKVKELNAVPNGKSYAAGNDTFVKKSGKWYLSQVEGVQGFDDKGLLTLVSPDAKEDIAAKIEKDKKSGYNLGVTIRGDQFVGGGAAKSATFDKKETGLYLDNTVIPTEIIAQYWFEEVQGNTDMGTIAASLMGEQGVQAKAFIRDEFAYVLQDSDLYILGTGNQNNPLEATRNLLEKLGKGIGGTNRLSVLEEAGATGSAPATPAPDQGNKSNTLQRIGAGIKKGAGAAAAGIKKGAEAAADAAVYTNYEKDATTLLSYRQYLNPDSQKTFALKIDDLQGLGELRDKIKASRTLAGKFFDLFSADDIKMTFVITQWGPAFVRKQMFGTRGGANIRGAMSRDDIKAFEDTGLFREMILPQMDTQVSYVAKAGVATDYTKAPKEDIEVKLDYVGIRQGFTVSGIEAIESLRRKDFDEAFKPTFADAYFLFYPPGAGNKKVIDLKGAPPPAPEPEATAPAAPEPPPDPWNDYNKAVEDALGGGYAELGGGYFTFPFDKSTDPTPEPGDYLAVVNDAFRLITDKIPQGENLDASSAKKFQIFVVGTADPVGEPKTNDKLSAARVKTFADRLATYGTVKTQLDKLKVTDNNANKQLAKLTPLSLGEEPWKERDEDWGAKDRKKYNDDARAPLRIAKLFIGPFDAAPDAAKEQISKLLMDKAKTLEQLKETVDLDPLRRQIRKILLETMRR